MPHSTVRRQKQLLLQSPLPSRQIIRRRFQKLFGPLAPQLSAFIEPCAEEAEKIILELATPELNPPAQADVQIMYFNNWRSRVRIKSYCCPSCNSNALHYKFHYCPSCGIKINWIN